MKVNKDVLLGEYFDSALEETIKIVKIPSYKKEAANEFGRPIDEDIKKTLEYCVNLMKNLGFKTFIEPDYKYGYADYGNGDKLFGIICHLDVVPPGNIEEWNTDPFNPVIKDGKLYGRGTFDDKGPTMANIFAFKYLIDHGFKPDYTVRFIFGTSEETTWECMEAYVKNEKICDLGYVPDAQFPVVYAEKWIREIDIKGRFECDFEISGGEAYNAVNDLVKYKGPRIDEISDWLNKNGIETAYSDGYLYVKGISSHGSLPFKGRAASTWLLKAMYELGFEHPLIDFVTKYNHLNYDMKEIFGDLTDETGSMTVCNGLMRLTHKDYSFGLDFRIPCTRDPEKDVINVISEFIKQYGMTVEVISSDNRVYLPKNSDVVQKIMSVYKEVTGDIDAEPIAIGGGTFAKSMPNTIAFGAEFDLEFSTMHAYNEYIDLEEFKKMMEIYAKSLAKLTKFN